MLPVIQENILLLKMIQVGAETLLGLLLGYLTGEALFKLRFALPGQPDSANFSKSAGGGSHPQILSGWRTGLFLVLCLSCNLLAIKIAYGVALLPGPFWGALVVFFIVGLALLLPARQRLVHGRPLGNLLFSAGLAGEVLLLAIVFLLLNAESLLLRPEAWPFVGGRALLLLSWHGLARFAEYLLLSLLLAAIVRLRPGARPPDRWACPVALAAVLILPLCLLGEVAATPRLADSLPFFTLAVPIPAIAAAVAFLLAAFWTGRMQAAFKSLLTLSCLLFLLWVLPGFAARETVLTRPALAGLSGLGTIRAAAGPEQLFATQAEAPAKVDGAALFNQKCTVCHRFDQRLVGPPLDSVLPKYRGDRPALQAFLRKPSKIDPDYPAMPNLSLTEQETAALAEFLLNRVEKPQLPDKP
jgi:cytochrome c551/c552